MKRSLKRICLLFAKALRAIKKSIVKSVDPDVDLDNVHAIYATPSNGSCYPIDISVRNEEEVSVDVILEVIDKTASGNVNMDITYHVAPGEVLLKEVYVSSSAYMLDFRKSVFVTDVGEIYYMHKRCVPTKNIYITVTANPDGTMSIKKRKATC